MIRLARNPSVERWTNSLPRSNTKTRCLLHLRANLLGSPTACSHTHKQTLWVFVDRRERCLFMCTAHKPVSRMLTHTAFTVSTLAPIEEPWKWWWNFKYHGSCWEHKKKKKKKKKEHDSGFIFLPRVIKMTIFYLIGLEALSLHAMFPKGQNAILKAHCYNTEETVC